MSVALSVLVARLEAMLPARAGVPSSAQYESCVQDAVADLGSRRPNQKVTTLSIVSGTAAYALPSDFLRPITIETLLSTDGVLITDAGLLPVDADWEEMFTYAGRTLTLTPTPTYTASRRLWYAAGHVLNASEAYPDLTSEEAGLALLKAAALGLQLQAIVGAGSGWKYQIGDEMVDKSGLARSLDDQAARLEQRYEAGLRAAGAFGVRGDWTEADM